MGVSLDYRMGLVQAVALIICVCSYLLWSLKRLGGDWAGLVARQLGATTAVSLARYPCSIDCDA